MSLGNKWEGAGAFQADRNLHGQEALPTFERSIAMLKDKSSSAIIAVSDIGRARTFYGETLGLVAEEDMGDVVTYRTGDTFLVVYKSEFAGTNKGNAVVWDVGDDIAAITRDLKAKGVTFEHYDMDGVEMDGDMHVAGDFRMVWFKDPDGNILHMNSM